MPLWIAILALKMVAPLLACIAGFVVIWLALTEANTVMGIIGGCLFGGGFVFGVLGRF